MTPPSHPSTQPLTAGELLALLAIASTSRAPGAPALVARLHDLLHELPTTTERNES